MQRETVECYKQLTLYIKISASIGSCLQSIISSTPVFSRITSFGLDVKNICISHNLSIFDPLNVRGWVPNGSAMESHFVIFNNFFINRFGG